MVNFTYSDLRSDIDEKETQAILSWSLLSKKLNVVLDIVIVYSKNKRSRFSI